MKPSVTNGLIIAGTHSGCGKTTVTLALMAALCRRGLDVRPFKCGPDFIDPTLHQRITGRLSRNLDQRMCGAEYVSNLYAHCSVNDGISIIEGVMGLFDGGNGSAAALARLLDVPVLLVVDVRSAAESVAAVVRGFETLDSEICLAGVIFNRVGSERHQQMITRAVQQHCRTEIIGSLPRNNSLTLPSRHLGLHLGSEIELDTDQLAELVERHLDLDRLLSLCQEVGKRACETPGKRACETPGKRACETPGVRIQETEVRHIKPVAQKVRIGVARDEAFCFYYQDNLDMLQQAGAELVAFSPVHDSGLPPDLDGLYFCGGYPELHGEKLAANQLMRQQVLAFSRSKRPVYGECGGFMYLTMSIIDADGKEHPMVGVYPTVARMDRRLRRLGYRQAAMQMDTILGTKGSRCHGHEFHYSAIEPMDETVLRGYVLDDGRIEGYMIDNTLAGYVHLHWGQTPQAATHFVEACTRLSPQGRNE